TSPGNALPDADYALLRPGIDGRSLCRLYNLAIAAGAHQPAGHRAGVLAALEDRRASDQRRLVPLDALNEAPAIGRHVVHQLRLVQLQRIEVDHINVGAQPRRKPAAVVEPEELRGLAGLTLDEQFER